MADGLLHAKTAVDIDGFVRSPGHALLISGPAGVGKGSIAQDLALGLLESAHKMIADEPGILAITPQGTNISIDAVRELRRFMSLKTVSGKPIARVAIIEDAHAMSPEAQNALLKLLEEPPTDSVLILTATSEHSLLPTIRSRLQHIAAVKPADDVITAHFIGRGYPSPAVDRALKMSGSLPGLMAALLEESEDHPLHQAAISAREVLQANAFERQCLVDKLSKERQLAIDTCDMLGRMAAIALKSPNTTQNQLKRWQNILSGALKASDDLSRYVQPKLVLSRYLLSF